MKILLFGKNGQVGWELQRALAPLGDLIALDRRGERGLSGDLSNLDALAAMVRAVAPDVIVNAAAYTAVDRAEAEAGVAATINGAAPGVLAREAAARGAWLVHYSSDYVFDGSGDRPRDESSACSPLSVYGRTKLDGELAVVNGGAKHLIFRTSWIYAARGDNFARTMLRLAQERERLRVVADQVGAPTGAELIADVTAHALRMALRDPRLGGLYHLAAGGDTSWHGYAKHVIEWARERGRPIRVAPDAIEPIASSDYPAAARRPLNSRLDTERLRHRFDLVLPDWRDGVNRMLAETLGPPVET
ncbi:MAG TPA: dTDP-4-dehydrorhamnose reductase [Albitalea sp.]|uniref:dTDP-4-dehydrorhamnose reductase n=1 Tax=Piscinibacter sp. TaxID=1903157 RepID=UPI002ED4165D